MEERPGIGGAIKHVRERRGYSQGGLSRRINYMGKVQVAQGYISQVEQGVIKNVGSDKLEVIAAALGVTVDALLDHARGDTFLVLLQSEPEAELDPNQEIENLRTQGVPDKDLAELIQLWPSLSSRTRARMLDEAYETAALEQAARQQDQPGAESAQQPPATQPSDPNTNIDRGDQRASA